MGKQNNRKKFFISASDVRKNKHKHSWLFYVILAVIIGAFGFGIYQGWGYYQEWSEQRDVVASYINDNVMVYNETSSQSRDIVAELNELVNFDTDDVADTEQRIISIKMKIEEIAEINTQIDESIEKLDPGTIQETKNLSNDFQSTLRSKQFTLNTLSEFLNYQVCLIDNATNQSINLENFTEQIQNFSQAEGVSFEEKNRYIKEANTAIKENITLINNVENCFTNNLEIECVVESEEKCFSNNYEQYLTQELKDTITKDKNLYENFNKSLDELEQGLESNNSETVVSATTKLVALSEQEITLFSSEEMLKAIQEPTQIIQNQAEVLDTQEEQLETTLNKLKGEYFLESPTEN